MYAENVMYAIYKMSFSSWKVMNSIFVFSVILCAFSDMFYINFAYFTILLLHTLLFGENCSLFTHLFCALDLKQRRAGILVTNAKYQWPNADLEGISS